MGFTVFTTPVYPGTVKHDVHRQFAPWQRRNGRLMQQTDGIVANKQLLALLTDIQAKRPWLVSYFNKCAMPAASASSLIATTVISARRPDSYRARTTLRPMRPKPLIAMRMVIDLLQGCPCYEVADRVIQQRSEGNLTSCKLRLID